MKAKDVKAQRISNHLEFIKFCRNSKQYHVTMMPRNIAYKEDLDGFNAPTVRNESLLENKVNLHPESAAFLFHIEGCPRRLLTYLIYFEIDPSLCIFKFNAQTIHDFQTYCALFDRQYEASVIKKGLRDLVDSNVLCNVARGKYMINPLLFGGKTQGSRRELIRKYDTYNMNKKRDPVVQLYPVYTK